MGPQTVALKLVVLHEANSMVRFKVREYGCVALYPARMKGDRDMAESLESRGATLGLLAENDRENWDEEDGNGNWRLDRVRTMFVH